MLRMALGKHSDGRRQIGPEVQLTALEAVMLTRLSATGCKLATWASPSIVVADWLVMT